MKINAQKDPFKDIFGSLDKLADLISNILKCPVTIEDVNHNLLAYSTHDERTDNARIATIIGRRVPERVINSLWNNGIIPKLLQNTEPIRINKIDEIGLGKRVAIAIRNNQEVLGFIWVLEIDKHLTEQDFEVLKNAAKAAANHILSVQNKKKDSENINQEFFWQLLTGFIQRKEDIEKGFNMLGVTPPALFTVIVFRFSTEIEETLKRQIYYSLNNIQNIKIILTNIDFNNLILLVTTYNNDLNFQLIKDFIFNFKKYMKERFGINNIKGSCGCFYNNLTFVEKCYKEALLVHSIRNKLPDETQNIIGYQELGIYQYLEILLNNKATNTFINQAINKLKKYDQKHKSQLYKTLEVYLNKDCNINEASKILHVHTNTLNYRLKRISEICNINLNDINQKVAVFIEMKLDKLKQSIC